jgi:excisionase family DNA binding protein
MMTVSEAAEALGLPKHDVYVLVDKGELAAEWVGAWLRIDPNSIDGYRRHRLGCPSVPTAPGRLDK